MVRVMVFNATSTIFKLYRGGQFYWWRKLEYAVKTTDLRQIIDKLYRIQLYPVHFTKSEIWTHNFSDDKQLLAWVILNPITIRPWPQRHFCDF